MKAQLQETKKRHRNTILKYRAIKDEFRLREKENKGMPTARIWREYIYPKFYISRQTLYNIIFTPDSELNED